MRKNIGKLAGVLAIFTIVLMGIRFRSMAALYPKLKENIYSRNTEVELEDDIWMSVISDEFKDNAYVKNMESYDTGFEKYDEKIYLVKIKLQNRGDIPREVDMTRLRVVSRSWHNAILYQAFQELNPGGTLYPKLLPDESSVFILPYYMFELQFKVRNWKSVTDREYYLVYQLYPEKESIKLR